jgi:hypothetical protein
MVYQTRCYLQSTTAHTAAYKTAFLLDVLTLGGVDEGGFCPTVEASLGVCGCTAAAAAAAGAAAVDAAAAVSGGTGGRTSEVAETGLVLPGLALAVVVLLVSSATGASCPSICSACVCLQRVCKRSGVEYSM